MHTEDTGLSVLSIPGPQVLENKAISEQFPGNVPRELLLQCSGIKVDEDFSKTWLSKVEGKFREQNLSLQFEEFKRTGTSNGRTLIWTVFILPDGLESILN